MYLKICVNRIDANPIITKLCKKLFKLYKNYFDYKSKEINWIGK
jgi:hypothetical protein